MKKTIHPKYYDKVKITCACGNSFTSGSTLEEITVDICNKCHPFFTGEMRLIDIQGRIEKFEKKRADAKSMGTGKRGKNKASKRLVRPSSLKEMLDLQKSKKSTHSKPLKSSTTVQ